MPCGGGDDLRWFPSRSSRRYTQVQPAKKSRHSGRDCRNPEAMEGNSPLALVFASVDLQAPSFTSLWTGCIRDILGLDEIGFAGFSAEDLLKKSKKAA